MQISQITETLYIAPRQKVKDVRAINQLNLGLIIDMVIYLRPPQELQELDVQVLSLPAIDFVLIPIPIRLLDKGVKAALPVIRDGQKVLVYCMQGRHRSVAMASCILIAMGYSAEDAMKLVDEKRDRADPYAWHIQRQIRRFEVHWRSTPITSTE